MFIKCNRKDCRNHEYAVLREGDYCRSYLIDYLPTEVKEDGSIICGAYEKYIPEVKMKVRVDDKKELISVSISEDEIRKLKLAYGKER